MKDFKNFIYEYRGAIIGAIIGIIVLCTGFLKIALWLIVIGFGIFMGNYIQQNKYEVKQKIVDFINRL